FARARDSLRDRGPRDRAVRGLPRSLPRAPCHGRARHGRLVGPHRNRLPHRLHLASELLAARNVSGAWTDWVALVARMERPALARPCELRRAWSPPKRGARRWKRNAGSKTRISLRFIRATDKQKARPGWGGLMFAQCVVITSRSPARRSCRSCPTCRRRSR